MRSNTKLNNLNMLMTIALYFIYSCKDLIEKIAKAFPKSSAIERKIGACCISLSVIE